VNAAVIRDTLWSVHPVWKGAAKRLAVAAAAFIFFLPLAAGLLTESLMHIPPGFRPQPELKLAQALGEWSEAEIRAVDGIALRAWFARPEQPNGGAVILLHGVADSRRGTLLQARMLREVGYAVLLPDSRAHGVSEGDLTTFGVLEREDVRRWCDWLSAQPGVRRVYGLGISMGAAVLLQSLPVEPRLRAVVAESSFFDFRAIGKHRLRQITHIPAEWLHAPLVECGRLYVRWTKDVDLEQASPAAGIRDERRPILLIHGTADSNIPIAQSRALKRVNPAVELWEVPGAHHAFCIHAAPEEYKRRVLAFFAGR
jgi:dipeptidyl aminopeptidase/acylaminoacyl peptidase